MTGDAMTAMINLRSTVLQDVDDDGRILIINDNTGSMQLSEVSPAGEWRALTDLTEPVTGRYLPGSPRQVVVSVNPSGTERTQLSLLNLEESTAVTNGVPELRPLVHDPDYIHTLLDVSTDQIVYTTNRRDGVEFDIVMHTVSTGEERVLYDGGGSFDDIAVSPDARQVLASRMTLLAASTQLLLLDLGTGEVQEITDPAIPGEWESPQWLADGSVLANTDSGGERFEVRRWSPVERAWSPVHRDADADVRIVLREDEASHALVRSCDGADTLSITRNDISTEAALPGVGVITRYNPLRWSPNGSWFGFTYSAPGSPDEAMTWSAGTGVERRTVSNDAAELPRLQPLESHRVPAPDGEQIPVFVVRGERTDGSAVLYIHGGPEAQAPQGWSPYIAALAMAGHTVLVPNVRGSAGYGRRWVGLDDVEKRLDSVADLAAIHRWLPSIGVDQRRVALMGGSYGGYMVLAGLTFHAGLWAAGVDIVGISSLTSFLENTSPYRRAYREREYGSLVEHREVLDAASPLPIIDRLAVPLFVIHGRHDPRVPLSEAEQVVAAVRANGAECELLVYDDEGHGLAKRSNRLDAYPRVAEFLAQTLGAVQT